MISISLNFIVSRAALSISKLCLYILIEGSNEKLIANAIALSGPSNNSSSGDNSYLNKILKIDVSLYYIITFGSSISILLFTIFDYSIFYFLKYIKNKK